MSHPRLAYSWLRGEDGKPHKIKHLNRLPVAEIMENNGKVAELKLSEKEVYYYHRLLVNGHGSSLTQHTKERKNNNG